MVGDDEQAVVAVLLSELGHVRDRRDTRATVHTPVFDDDKSAPQVGVGDLWPGDVTAKVHLAQVRVRKRRTRQQREAKRKRQSKRNIKRLIFHGRSLGH